MIMIKTITILIMMIITMIIKLNLVPTTTRVIITKTEKLFSFSLQ